VKAAIVRPPSMVERKVLGSNLRRFLAAGTGVVLSPFQCFKDAQEPLCSEKQLCYSQFGRSTPTLLSGITKADLLMSATAMRANCGKLAAAHSDYG
jgi:hypothetical protein